MARPSDATAKAVDKQSSGMSSTSSKGVVADDGDMASGPVWVTSGWVPKHMFNNDEARAATYLKELDREWFCSRDYRRAFQHMYDVAQYVSPSRRQCPSSSSSAAGATLSTVGQG